MFSFFFPTGGLDGSLFTKPFQTYFKYLGHKMEVRMVWNPAIASVEDIATLVGHTVYLEMLQVS